ncbi:TIGR04219 family outer membrane beta-barrel protein [Shewanella holmiensis]|uniref:TIGR04219 family outer membrane beta-barrel protein n=1 Tax=Shewanella holmiensis TaxID=2952222 RepID=A0A9X2WMW9_9GAMM|nr:TIGR04219 family outer membrane beta-barrel protein [Shewanella holmiensis]MCT7942366.1 TIGR04219 family outer membrane beta-barrel protein [Shewanella holmiensis]
MNKTLVATALFGLLSVSSAQAATVMGFKVGGDIWNTDASGTFNADSNAGNATGPAQNYDYGSKTQGSVWLAIEHPIPLVPNLKIRENRLEASGSKDSSDFYYNQVNFTGASTVYNDLSNTDFVLYYEILDNDLVALDLGAAYKQMHGSLRVDGFTGSGLTGTATQRDIDSGVVMAYGSAQVGVPGLGLFAFADVMLGLDESGVHDYSAGLGWQFDGVALDTLVRVGYRDFNFDVNGFSDTTQDMQFKGAFAGVELIF